MSEKPFKQKFKELMDDASKLVKEATPKEIEEIKVNLFNTTILPSSDLVCKTDEEFDLRVLYRITGVIGELPYILIHHDELTDAQIEKHRQKALSEHKKFILPSIVEPISNHPDRQFTPYLVFPTHDKLLFLLPLEGSAFSDIEFEDPQSESDEDLEDDFDFPSEDEE